MSWKEENDALHASFHFTDFVQALAFMMEVGFVAERLNHHPEWSNVYNKVTIKLTTHDAGNTITEKDHKLASHIDKVFERYQA